jgi:23S rRNA (guanosine2251-2'-O)-methyltransferase
MHSGKKFVPDNLFTLFGRQTVLEALQDPELRFFKLHLAESNKEGGIITDILQLAEKKGIDVSYHSRLALSRISRNGKQDQGVALDILMPQMKDSHTLIALMLQKPLRLIALDNITNPQNLGMILRSVCAGGMDGIILPKKGCARLDALVIKASAGTFFRTPVFICEKLPDILQTLQASGATLCIMKADAKTSLFEHSIEGTTIYILGNESEGVSDAITQLTHKGIAIPMQNGVESLNVAMTATLIAYHY